MTFKRLLLAAALFFGGGTAAFAQCTGGSIANCPAAVSPQPDDYLLGYQNAQNPHTRKFTLEQAAAGANTLNVGSTPISNGTNAYLLFNNNGVLGNEAVSSLNIALNQLPVLTANTVLGALTATRPIELSLPSCSGATDALIWTSGTGFGCNTFSSGGTVTTTGSPSAGDIATFSGATSITNVAQTGTGSVVRATSPTVSALTVTGSLTATGLVTNSDLVSPSITVNGTTCTLGASCTPAGASGITALTGDGTASGPGSAALTLATVNSGPGSVGSSTAIPVLTTNGKGLVTAQTTAVVVAPAGTLTGATLASNVLASSLTSVGTLAGLSVTGSFTATGLVTNADLVNAATTVNGQSCVLGAACTISASAGTVTVGTTTIASGTDTRVLFDNAGVLGEYTISGSGNVAMTTGPTIASPTITGAFTATGLVTNADLVSPSVTVNGTTCTLGSSCTPQAGGIIAGTTALAGTSSRILYDNGSVVSESAGLTYDGTSVLTLGVAGASVGGLALKNATSGTVNIAPVTGALGTVTLSAPARTATLATTTGSLTNGDCAKFDSSGNLVASGAGCGTGSGSVTTVSVASANGFAGTVANATTTPAITISTSITGALKGNGTAVSQAACSDLSNGATGCSTATGTSGATLGLLNANKTDSGVNVWSGQQSVSVETISAATSTLTPTGAKQDYTVTLVHANTPFTLANMTSVPPANTHGVIKVIQSATGSDLISTWGSSYQAPGGTATVVLSTGASAVDFLAYVSDGTTVYITPLLNFSH